jgi:CheY-like chemotaxis protein
MAITSSRTILLVAGDADSAQDLRRLLEAHGHAFAHASSAQEAIEWLRGESSGAPMIPALILIDWTLTTGDGARLLSRVASDPRLSPVPVVVLAEISQMRSIPTLQVSATLAKPVRPRTLLDVLAALRGPMPVELERTHAPPESTARLRASPPRMRRSPGQRLSSEDQTVRGSLVDELSARQRLEDRTVRTFESGPHEL